MRKVLALLIIVSSLISFSYAFEIFGVNFPSSKYGGAVVVYPMYPLIWGVAGSVDFDIYLLNFLDFFIF